MIFQSLLNTINNVFDYSKELKYTLYERFVYSLRRKRQFALARICAKLMHQQGCKNVTFRRQQGRHLQVLSGCHKSGKAKGKMFTPPTVYLEWSWNPQVCLDMHANSPVSGGEWGVTIDQAINSNWELGPHQLATLHFPELNTSLKPNQTIHS